MHGQSVLVDFIARTTGYETDEEILNNWQSSVRTVVLIYYLTNLYVLNISYSTTKLDKNFCTVNSNILYSNDIHRKSNHHESPLAFDTLSYIKTWCTFNVCYHEFWWTLTVTAQCNAQWWAWQFDTNVLRLSIVTIQFSVGIFWI